MHTQLASRLKSLRALMMQEHVDIVLVRSTDPYLNEYVPLDESLRYYITGFSGSVGDALITQQEAILFVDGRYRLQAAQEAAHFDVRVLPLGQSIEQGWLDELAKQGAKHQNPCLLIESSRVSMQLYERIVKTCEAHAITLQAKASSLIERLKEDAVQPKTGALISIDPQLTGASLLERLSQCEGFFAQHQIDAQLMIPLDEIAWLTNLRGHDFPYQATFAARALVFPNQVWLMAPDASLPRIPALPGLHTVSEDKLHDALGKIGPVRIGYVPEATPLSMVQLLKTHQIELVPVKSPFGAMKAQKTPAELLQMRMGFATADRVVETTVNWVCEQVLSGTPVSEADVDQHIRAGFHKSGAMELSFKPICASEKNGAVIHYGTPSPTVWVKPGTQFLLDTGGIYEAGYSTDLTRTFWVGNAQTPPSKKHQQIYTAVLKGAIAGMSARFPKGTTGAQLDAIVRAPIWQEGYNYEHGTGHGVGINVHEFPPRIGPGWHQSIEVGHVFSIEPGIYLPGFGGVRIENVCTLVDDPDNRAYARVLPLTFAPLDKCLVDRSMLTLKETAFLDYFERCYRLQKTEFPPLPPI